MVHSGLGRAHEMDTTSFFAAWAVCMGIATHTSENFISDYLSISAIGLLIGYGWLWMPVYLNTFFKGHGSATITFNRVIIVGVFMFLAIVFSMRIETLIVAFSAATAASHFLLKHKKRVWTILDWEYEQEKQYRRKKD